MADKAQQLIDELDRLAKAILNGQSDIATIEHRIHLNRKRGREILFELLLILPHRQYLRLVEQKTGKRG